MSHTAVMIIVIVTSWMDSPPATVIPVYFESMEACESAAPAVVEQMKSVLSLQALAKAACYEEAAPIR